MHVLPSGKQVMFFPGQHQNRKKLCFNLQKLKIEDMSFCYSPNRASWQIQHSFCVRTSSQRCIVLANNKEFLHRRCWSFLPFCTDGIDLALINPVCVCILVCTYVHRMMRKKNSFLKQDDHSLLIINSLWGKINSFSSKNKRSINRKVLSNPQLCTLSPA